MTVTGIVLAGGRSTRMGHDKALLPFGGETLIARAVRIVREVADALEIAGETVFIDEDGDGTADYSTDRPDFDVRVTARRPPPQRARKRAA